jgi:glycogen operon protein
MLLAGDEFGNTQAGNNNAYAQDNEIGWLDWTRLDEDHEFVEQVRAMIQVRQENRLLRQSVYRHGQLNELLGRHDVEWFGPTGALIAEREWPDAKALGLLLVDMEIDGPPLGTLRTDEALAVCLLLNAADHSQEFVLPVLDVPGNWLGRFSSAGEGELRLEPGLAELSEWSLACLEYRANVTVTP